MSLTLGSFRQEFNAQHNHCRKAQENSETESWLYERTNFGDEAKAGRQHGDRQANWWAWGQGRSKREQ